MTHDAIEKLIDALNRGELRDRIFTTALSDTVDSALVWLDEPRGNIANEESRKFYFIKNTQGLYVAAVFDMYDDLHVFVKKEHRGRGHLCNALNEVIFPKLFQEMRAVQTVKYEDKRVGDYLVRHLGFTLTGPSSAEKDLSSFAGAPPIQEKHARLSRADFDALRRDINRAKLYLKVVKERIEMAYGECDELDLDELIYDGVGNLDDCIFAFIEGTKGGLKD